MRTFAGRRLRNTALTLVGLAGIAIGVRRQELSLDASAFATGYLLLGAIVFLALYNLRKKLSVLPWTTSAGWLQTHIYVGLGSIVVCALHVGWRWPSGVLDTTLAGLYLGVFISGVVGLVWTRTLPPRLARVSEEVIYERIPRLRSQVRERAEAVVLDTVRTTGAITLGEFYAHRLHGFFEKSRGVGYYLRPTSRLRRQLLAELTEVNRYLSDAEQEASEQLFALVRRRDDLDFQAALQWRLKAWLFLHIGLTYPLLAAACLHGWLAHLFYGGAL